MVRYIYFLMMLLLISCEEVIEIELNNAAQIVIVQGGVSNIKNESVIKLTKSTDYFNPNENEKISGALVTISENMNTSWLLYEAEQGTYKISDTNFTAKPGNLYTINIQYESKEYTAFSYMMPTIPIDSIIVSTEASGIPFGGGGGGGMNSQKRLKCYFTDTQGLGNGYMMKLKSSNPLYKPSVNYLILEDKFTDGNSNSLSVRWNFSKKDTVEISLYSLDKAAFNFYNTLNKISGRGGPLATTQTPENPLTNLSDGAQGFFAAYSIDRKIFVVK